MMPEEIMEHRCVLCNAKLKTKEALQEHFRKHANKEIDSRGNPTKKYLKTQVTCAPPPPENSPLNATCDVCNEVFPTAAKAMNHKWKMHPGQPSRFCCPYCGKQFPLKTIHDKHVEEEHGRQTLNKSPSRVVTILHCDECGEQFFNEAAKTYHIKITHARTKSVLKPVACPPPSRKIRVNNAGDAESVYYCHICGAEYVLKFNLRKHIMQCHAEEADSLGPESEIICCTMCEAIFWNRRAYDAHNKYHQPGDKYVTSEEHRLQTVSRVDQDFDIRRVQVRHPKTIQGYVRQRTKLKMILWNPAHHTYDPNSTKNEESKPEPEVPMKKRPRILGRTTNSKVLAKSSCTEEPSNSEVEIITLT